MKYIPEINLQDYFYNLPPEKIAEYPLEDRASSKLLYVDVNKPSISHYLFKQIPSLIPQNSLLIFNTTRVIKARLNLKKKTGGRAEILCLEPVSPFPSPELAMKSQGSCVWTCIIGGKRINPGKELHSTASSPAILKFIATIIEKTGNEGIVEFKWEPASMAFSEILDILGNVPLPPYIKREPVESDKIRYQTVYAQHDGSVAAPTAGLHFTDEILNEIKSKGLKFGEVILDVGLGTFKPIGSDNISSHDMHRERFSINREFLETLINHIKDYSAKSPIIATGTTTLRTIESLYWLGLDIYYDNITIEKGMPLIGQWSAYKYLNEEKTLPAELSLRTLLDWMSGNKIETLTANTKLFIVPSYQFQIVNGLITNFHLPGSTLILLVAAFLGNDLWRRAYDAALGSDYRFLSYGDGSLLSNY